MIHLEERDALAVLRLEHGKANAVDLELFEDLAGRLDEVAASGARAMVVTGTGGVFSAGLDLLRVLREDASYLDRLVPLVAVTLRRLFAFELPVVAAVNGHAIAGGCLLAAACDLRVMAEGEAKLGVTELKVGVPFPAAALEVLRYLLPVHRVQQLVLSGRLLSPAQALEVGLVDELSPPGKVLERAVELAGELAAVPRGSFAVTKRHLRHDSLERMERLSAELDGEIHRLWTSDEVRGVMRTFVETQIGRRR